MKKLFSCLVCCLCAVILFLSGQAVYADTTETSTYGSGDYGSCNYGSCPITLTSTGSTNIDVTPTAAGRCTVHSDTATVQTGNSNGYTLTMTTSTTNNALASASGSIATSGGTSSSPASLATNSWGYRVDGLDGFGPGPTIAQDSQGTPSVTFAGIPPSDQTAALVASNNQAVDVGEDTAIWYGVCADTNAPADLYSATVTYTAVAN